jgi:hypothetical protein
MLIAECLFSKTVPHYFSLWSEFQNIPFVRPSCQGKSGMNEGFLPAAKGRFNVRAWRIWPFSGGKNRMIKAEPFPL